MFKYRALLEKEGEGYNVSFPDFPSCFTCGDNLEDTLFMAEDALGLYLLSLDDLGLAIPKPSQGEGFWINIDKKISFALQLKKIRKEKELTQLELARRLHMTQPAYQRLEDPKKTNPSLNTITKIEKAIGKKILEVV